MRRPVPIVGARSSTLTASYYGGLNPRIVVTTRAMAELTQDEMNCLILHELGHHNLWHCERSFGILLATAVTVIGAWWSYEWTLGLVAWLAGHLIFIGSRALAEVEADRYACIMGSSAELMLAVLSKVAHAHPAYAVLPIYRLRVFALRL